MRKLLLLWLILLSSIGFSQQITLDTSDTANESGGNLPQGTIEQYWYWSWGFRVDGTGFSPNSEITVFAIDPNGIPWRNFMGTSDGSGNFSIRISAKKIRSVLGEHTVTATDGTSTVTAILTVIANMREVLNTSSNLELLTQTEFNTTGLTINTSGIAPNAEVKLNIQSPNSSSEIDPATPKYADGNGEFEMSINASTPSIPWGWMPEVPGVWSVTVYDWSGNSHYGATSFRILPDNPSPSNYCTIEQMPSPTGQQTVYPITSFEIVGVNSNTSSENSENYYENFTSSVFNLNAGDTYTVKIKGKNSSGFAADTYTLFIDWNQNGILDEDNEVYHEGYIFNSTGTDDKFTEFQITIPENALSGETRLRILKVESANNYAMYWPIGACGYYSSNGQVEDYTLTIEGGIELPECTINCPENISIEVEEGTESAIVEYDLSFDCEEVFTDCEIVYPSNNFENGLLTSNNYRIANDFDVPAGTTMTVKQVVPNLIRTGVQSAVIYFYRNNEAGGPGELITSFENVVPESQNQVGTNSGAPVFETVFDLPESIELEEGKYWIALGVTGNYNSWETTSQIANELTYSWINSTQSWNVQSGHDGVFKVVYECLEDPTEETEIVLVSGLPSGSEFPVGTTIVNHNLVYNGIIIDTCSFEVTVEEMMGVSELNNSELAYYPNPVKDILNISYTKEISNVKIYELSGKQVYAQGINNTQAKINVSQLGAGIYIVKAEVSGQFKTFKIVKK